MRGTVSKRNRIIVGLDIGTTKICCIISTMTDEGGIDIVGLGLSPSRGMRKGVVVNIESTVEAIKKAVEEAELMAGVQVNAVHVGISGTHINGFNSRGVVAIHNGEVTRSDIERAINAAKTVAIPQDRRILHVLPQAYIVDDQDGIHDPLGICGVRLEVDVHIITGASMTSQNLIRSVNRAGLEVVDLILQPLASSKAVLTPEEMELGVAMVDLGGGTTDLAILSQDSLLHTVVLPIGGNHLSQDVAVGLRTPQAEAEKIKVTHGCALSSMVAEDETIEVVSVGGRPPRVIPRKVLSDVLQPRVEEIFELVGREVKRGGHEGTIVAGLVVSGGTALLDGIMEVGERVLDVPVRVGRPTGVGGLKSIVGNPMYATAVGLVVHAWSLREEKELSLNGHHAKAPRVFQRMKQWVKEFF